MEWWLTGVCGPNNSSRRKDWWEELYGLFGLCTPNWCLWRWGDFNVVRKISERLNGIRLDLRGMKDFDLSIRECELVDLFLCNARFPRSDLQENFVFYRLDRFSLSLRWEGVFPNLRQETLPRLLSDHCPIIIESWPLKWGLTPFRFENMGLECHSFMRN